MNFSERVLNIGTNDDIQPHGQHQTTTMTIINSKYETDLRCLCHVLQLKHLQMKTFRCFQDRQTRVVFASVLIRSVIKSIIVYSNLPDLGHEILEYQALINKPQVLV